MPLLDVDVLAEVALVSHRDRRAWLALRLRARAAAADAVHVVLTIDRSSSMTGSKLEHARLAGLAVVQMMADDDELTILAFDEQVGVRLPRRHMNKTGKRAARHVLAELEPGEGTALYVAAEQSLLLANETARGHAILITDGLPFSGVIDAAQILAMIARRASAATLTTIGVGSWLDPALLVAIARTGGGRFLHVDEHGNVADILAAELAAVHRAVTGKLSVKVRAARGFSLATVPHYAVRGSAAGAHNVAMAALPPVLESESLFIPFELEWEADLKPRVHRAALVTVCVGAPGSSTSRVLEIPVRLHIGRARGAMDDAVTRAVCELTAATAVHRAAVGQDTATKSARLLAEATGWIRGRASIAGLDPGVDLAPSLRALDAAHDLVQRGEDNAATLLAAAEGVAKHYAVSVGARRR
jgi:hypothetical protein